MKYLLNDSLDPSLNLAIEEVVLDDCRNIDEPVFCLWRNTPSVIIGISQIAENEVNTGYVREHAIPVIRRATGGGAVYHDLGNVNFSLFVPPHCSRNGYNDCFSLLEKPLESLGIKPRLSATNDMLVNGRKFSGMAKKTDGNGSALVHGTILFDVDMEEMAMVLCNPKGKFNSPKGIKSRHSEVINIKQLVGIAKVEDFMDIILNEIFSNDAISEIRLCKQTEEKAQKLSQSRYRSVI